MCEGGPDGMVAGLIRLALVGGSCVVGCLLQG